MERFDEKMRAARPDAPHLPPDFAAQVMGEIERQGLTVRPLWRVRGAVWLGRVAAAAALVTGVVVLNGAAYQLRSSGALELLHFGSRLLGGFLGQIPYDLLLTALLLGGAAAWLIRHARAVRVPVAWALLISYGLTGAGGLALAGSGLNESLQDAVLKEEVSTPGLSWFYGQRAIYHRPDPRFRMGRVIALDGQRARIQTPTGDEEEVLLPPGFQAQVGEDVRLIALPNGGVVRAQMAQRCNPASVQPYFRHHRMMQEMMRGMRPGGMGGGMGPMMRRMGPGGMDGGPMGGVGPMQPGGPMSGPER